VDAFPQEVAVTEQDTRVESEQEPAEGARPEDEERYERAEGELAEQPLTEPAEGGPEDADER
jgi:hypothetical protein